MSDFLQGEALVKELNRVCWFCGKHRREVRYLIQSNASVITWWTRCAWELARHAAEHVAAITPAMSLHGHVLRIDNTCCAVAHEARQQDHASVSIAPASSAENEAVDDIRSEHDRFAFREFHKTR